MSESWSLSRNLLFLFVGAMSNKGMHTSGIPASVHQGSDDEFSALWFRASVARLLRSVRVAEKISMKVDVRDPSCALIAMVPTLHRLKIARSGRRRRRFNVSALRNAYPFRKPDSWLKPRCRLWSLEERPTPLPLPSEESPNLLNFRHL